MPVAVQQLAVLTAVIRLTGKKHTTTISDKTKLIN